jgi:hypothetical protein
MELLFLMLGLLGLVVTIGGRAGFFSLLTSNNKDAKVREVERATNKLSQEITQLSTRLELLKKQVESQQQSPPLKEAALKSDAPMVVVKPVVEPNIEITSAPAENTNTISESELTEQVLAAVKPNIQAVPIKPVSASTSTPATPKIITRPPIKHAINARNGNHTTLGVFHSCV